RASDTARHPRPMRRWRPVASAETIDWRKGGELNAQGLRSPVFETGAVTNRLALPYGPSGRYRTCTSGVSDQRADFYATDGWSRRPESRRDRRRTKAVLWLVELQRQSALGWIRTSTRRYLRPPPLPIGLRGLVSLAGF